MATAKDLVGINSRRKFVVLAGGTVRQRASICQAVSSEVMHIEPVSGANELRLRDFVTVDVLLAWDGGETINELKGQLSIIGCWSPIIVINESPTVAQVVRAIMAGAIDYVHWTGDADSLTRTVAAAAEAKSRLLPHKQRVAEARRLLLTLSRRERQVVAAIAEGMSNKDIAKVLGISCRTVEIHRAHMMDKLQANSSADAIRMVLEASTASAWAYGDSWTAPWSLEDLLRPPLQGPTVGNDDG